MNASNTPLAPIRPISIPSHTSQGNLHRPETVTLSHPCGPVAVDIWQARQETGTPPVLLIHGWGGSGGYWKATAEGLAATAQVIVPDLPGTGRSQPVTSPQNMYDQVATLDALLQELQINQVQIVGHSMGGAMSLLLADLCPQRVHRLILTSMCFFLNEQQEQIYRAIMKVTYWTMRFRHPWLSAVPGMTSMMAMRYFHRIPDDEALLKEGLSDYIALDLQTAVACADNAMDETIPAAGRRIQAPTLLIACRQDQVMPVENVDFTVASIPGCQLRWIEECGHLPMVEKPAEYLGILESFLDLE